MKRELWPGDTFIDFDHGLAAAVNKIRDALCDSADKPKFVETLPRRGYRFIARMEPKAPVAIPLRLEKAPFLETKSETTDIEKRTPARHGNRTQAWAVGATLVLLGLAVATAAVMEKPEPRREEWNISQFTSYPGATSAPSFSQDGSRIAFGWDGGSAKHQDLYVKALGGEAMLQLTHHPAEWISSDWSPDGTQVAFLRIAGADTGLYVVPALGGPERKLRAYDNSERFSSADQLVAGRQMDRLR